MHNIYFIDDDENYVRVLEKKILMELYKEVEVYTITNEKYRKEYLSEFRNLDIVIIDETLYDETILKHQVAYTIVLERSKKVERRLVKEKELHVYKYQSVKEIYDSIYRMIGNYLGKERSSREKAEVLCIYSPIGGCGKTTAALGICNILGKKGKKVLYLDWEAIQSYKEVFEINQYLDDKVVYKIKNKKFDALTEEEVIGKQKYFDYLFPFQDMMLSWELLGEEFLYFIGFCKEKFFYDYIVIDTSCEFNYIKSKLFSGADKVIVVVEQSLNASHKMNSFFTHLDCSDSGKFKFLCNKYKEQEENCISKISFFRYTGIISGYISWNSTLKEWKEEEFLQFTDLKREVFRLI